jgi:hypothetical protein
MVRRRRRVRGATTVIAAAVVIVAVGAATVGPHRPARSPDPAQRSDRAAYEQLGAWADGDRLHVGRHTVTVPGLQRLQYSGAGVVVTGTGAPVLVDPSGTIESLDLDLLDSLVGVPIVGTDPNTPDLGYVRDLGDHRAQAEVVDLVTGAETTVGRPFTTRESDRATWLAGDLMGYVRQGEARVVDWRTGEPSRLAQHGRWQAAGVSIDHRIDGTWILRTLSGDSLLRVATDPATSYGTLSPNGRYFAVSDTDPGVTVYDLSDGSMVSIAGRAADYGWTPDGHLVGRSTSSSGEIDTCDPGTGRCDRTGTTTTGSPVLVTGTPGERV